MNFSALIGYEGSYEVSACGVIRSVDRVVLGTDGATYPFKGRILRANPHKDVNYLVVSLWKDGIGQSHYVHRLVAQAHVANPFNKPEVNHKDGDRTNNNKNNLEWVTPQENKLHAITTGLRKYTNRMTKDEFVDCLFSVIDGESYAALCNRVPYKVPFLSVKLRQIARELGVENDLNESLYQQRISRARINGAKNH